MTSSTKTALVQFLEPEAKLSQNPLKQLQHFYLGFELQLESYITSTPTHTPKLTYTEFIQNT